jgi:ferredoxin
VLRERRAEYKITSMTKVILDLDKCVACGMCVNVCSEIFEPDMSTLKVAIKGGIREGEKWTADIACPECVSHASQSCLMKAIIVE